MTSNQTSTSGTTPARTFVSDDAARERVRLAQKRETEGVRRYIAAARRVAGEFEKRNAALAVHDASIAKANERLEEAAADLVAVSGFERASILIDQPEPALRAAVRAHRGRTDTADGAV